MKKSRVLTTSAFTLVELLVVIAIIALLASLALPAISKSKEKASIVKSAANMKQIGLALKMYANDNNESYPVSGTDTAVNAYNLLIDEGLVPKTIFQRPGSGTAASTNALTMANTELDYGYTSGLTDVSPAGAAVAFEKVTLTTGSKPYKGAPLAGTWNKAGVNVLYVDGSVQWRKSNAGKTDVQNMWRTSDDSVGTPKDTNQ